MEIETSLQSWQVESGHSPQLLKQVASKLLIACLSSEVALMSQCKPDNMGRALIRFQYCIAVNLPVNVSTTLMPNEALGE